MAIWNGNLDPYGRRLKSKVDREEDYGTDHAGEHYVLQVLDAPITIHRAFVELAGSLNAAAILTDLAARSEASMLADDWVYIDSADWQTRLGLSYKEQLTARRVLEKKGFLKTIRTGLPPRTALSVAWVAIDCELRTRAENAAIAFSPVCPSKLLAHVE